MRSPSGPPAACRLRQASPPTSPRPPPCPSWQSRGRLRCPPGRAAPTWPLRRAAAAALQSSQRLREQRTSRSTRLRLHPPRSARTGRLPGGEGREAAPRRASRASPRSCCGTCRTTTRVPCSRSCSRSVGSGTSTTSSIFPLTSRDGPGSAMPSSTCCRPRMPRPSVTPSRDSASGPFRARRSAPWAGAIPPRGWRPTSSGTGTAR
mmetsp:Transcript_9264/g.21015  ORF Transcript_9264/g.21015 Transcript_9264/m.21015 type:complete len:206 (+) Transcript_9264:252-869(+)